MPVKEIPPSPLRKVEWKAKVIEIIRIWLCVCDQLIHDVCG
jgi:hypothetical protein